MKPLNYAILKYYTTIDEADAVQVMDALKADYGNYKPFKKSGIIEALMTAEANGLLEESKTELSDQKELRIFYKLNDYGRDMINSYIK
jgi:DNA-binding PadR family transcriptional regulator